MKNIEFHIDQYIIVAKHSLTCISDIKRGTLDFLFIKASSPTVFKRKIGLQLKAFFLSLNLLFNSSYSSPSSSGLDVNFTEVSSCLTSSTVSSFLTFFEALSASFSSEIANSAEALRFLFCSKNLQSVKMTC